MNIWNAIYDYAVYSGLATNPYVERRLVHRFLVIEPDGLFSIENAGTPESPVGRLVPLPCTFTRSGGDPFLIADGPEYVLGIPRKDAARARERHDLYVEMLRKAFQGTGDERLGRAVAFFEKSQNLHKSEKVENAKILDKEVFSLAFRDAAGTLVPLSAEGKIGEWWQNSFNAFRRNTTTGQCSITGQKSILQRIHGPVTGIGKDAVKFLSVYSQATALHVHGLSEGYACPTDVSVSLSIKKALESILSEKKGRRRSIRIGGMFISFFPGTTAADDACRALLSVIDPTDEEVLAQKLDDREVLTWRAYRDVFHAPKDPTAVPFPEGIPQDAQLDIAVFVPNGKRLQIRGFAQERFGNVWNNVAAWFKEAAVYDPFRKEVRSDFPLRTVNLWSDGKHLYERGVIDVLFTTRRGKTEEIPIDLVRAFYMSILEHKPFQPAVLDLALERMESWARGYRDSSGKLRRNLAPPAALAGVLKAFLIRNTIFKEVPLMLDTEFALVPYLLGRLIAVAEKIQKEAIYEGRVEVGASVIARYWSYMARTPGRVLGMIQEDLNHHLRKIAGSLGKPGLAWHYKTLIEEIMGKIPATETAIPASMNRQEQALYAVGFWHQQAALYAKKERAPEEILTV